MKRFGNYSLHISFDVAGKTFHINLRDWNSNPVGSKCDPATVHEITLFAGTMKKALMKAVTAIESRESRKGLK